MNTTFEREKRLVVNSLKERPMTFLELQVLTKLPFEKLRVAISALQSQSFVAKQASTSRYLMTSYGMNNLIPVKQLKTEESKVSDTAVYETKRMKNLPGKVSLNRAGEIILSTVSPAGKIPDLLSNRRPEASASEIIAALKNDFTPGQVQSWLDKLTLIGVTTYHKSDGLDGRIKGVRVYKIGKVPFVLTDQNLATTQLRHRKGGLSRSSTRTAAGPKAIKAKTAIIRDDIESLIKAHGVVNVMFNLAVSIEERMSRLDEIEKKIKDLKF